jgi:hypothetical protein
MNSLRANGVMSIQASSAVVLAISAVRKSAGILCTTHRALVLVMDLTGNDVSVADMQSRSNAAFALIAVASCVRCNLRPALHV